MSCELGLKETTEPTGGSQHREYWGGPTNSLRTENRQKNISPFFGDFNHKPPFMLGRLSPCEAPHSKGALWRWVLLVGSAIVIAEFRLNL